MASSRVEDVSEQVWGEDINPSTQGRGKKEKSCDTVANMEASLLVVTLEPGPTRLEDPNRNPGDARLPLNHFIKIIYQKHFIHKRFHSQIFAEAVSFCGKPINISKFNRPITFNKIHLQSSSSKHFQNGLQNGCSEFKLFLQNINVQKKWSECICWSILRNSFFMTLSSSTLGPLSITINHSVLAH